MKLTGTVRGTSTQGEQQLTAQGQALVKAQSTSTLGHISENAKNAFIIATGFQTYAANTDGVLFYLKNTHDDKDLHIESIRTCSYGTVLTAALNWARWQLFKNPASSDGASTLVAQNMNTASNNPLTATLKGGASGTALGNTDNPMANWINPEPAHSTDKYSGALIIAPGDDIAVYGRLIIAGIACATIQCFYSE